MPSERAFRELLRKARWSPWYLLTTVELWLSGLCRHDKLIGVAFYKLWQNRKEKT
ncbi:MAG: hypothetical protein WC455_13430 [Dehalococcoidia bacterium]|jgi:hypothetical protein